MTTIAAELRRLKTCLPDLITPAVIDRCVQGLPRRFRKRILTPVVVIQLLILRILEANTAYAHLPHLARIAFTPSAFCQALARLPLELLQSLLSVVGTQVDRSPPTPEDLFAGRHRVLLVDGLCVSMPDTPKLAAHFGYPAGQKTGLGFPVAKLLMLVDLSTGLIRRVLINPYRTHESSQASKLHPDLLSGDILVGDRGFCSFVHLALLLQRTCHGLFRAHQRLLWNFAQELKGQGMQSRILRSLGRDDRLIIYRKPTQRPNWISAREYEQLPQEITVREVRYRVTHKGFRSQSVMLVTTLVDPLAYPRAELAGLYGLRWRIETQFRHLKSTLNMAVLKGKSVGVIEREILAYVLVHNLVAREIRRSARTQGVLAERISFIDAVRWVIGGMRSGVPLRVNPLRTGRIEPRVRKRRSINYPYMTRPRDALRQELMRNSQGK